MALLEIISHEGVAMEHSFARGNIGTLVDIQSGKLNEVEIPPVTPSGGGGNIFINLD